MRRPRIPPTVCGCRPRVAQQQHSEHRECGHSKLTPSPTSNRGAREREAQRNIESAPCEPPLVRGMVSGLRRREISYPRDQEHHTSDQHSESSPPKRAREETDVVAFSRPCEPAREQRTISRWEGLDTL